MGTTKKDVGAYLSSEGLRPQETDFGYVFEYQNLTFLIFWDDDDDQYRCKEGDDAGGFDAEELGKALGEPAAL